MNLTPASVALLALLSAAAPVSAQSAARDVAGSLADLSVRPGSSITVDSGAGPRRGRFVSSDDTGVVFTSDGRDVKVAAADVRSIRWRRSRGGLGAAIGAAAGILTAATVIRSANNCKGCEDAAGIASAMTLIGIPVLGGGGALVGGLIGKSLRRETTIYQRPDRLAHSAPALSGAGIQFTREPLRFVSTTAIS